MARDLEQLKQILWEQFEKAVERQKKYYDSDTASNYYPSNNAITNRNAIANLANGIANIEREQREAAREKHEENERKNGITLPGKG